MVRHSNMRMWRIVFHLVVTHQLAFRSHKLDGTLLPVPVLGTVYTKVRDFMSKQVDLAQLQQGGAASRCTIM